MNINKNKILLLAIITINSMLFASTNAPENTPEIIKTDIPTPTNEFKGSADKTEDLNPWYVNAWNTIKTTEEKNPKTFWISTGVISIAIINALYAYFNNTNENEVDVEGLHFEGANEVVSS